MLVSALRTGVAATAGGAGPVREALEALDNIQGRVNAAVELLNAGLPSRGGPMHPVAAKLLGISIEVGKATAALASSAATPASPADKIIGQIEERFPDWKGFRDLIDCIDVTLHRLRGGR